MALGQCFFMDGRTGVALADEVKFYVAVYAVCFQGFSICELGRFIQDDLISPRRSVLFTALWALIEARGG